MYRIYFLNYNYSFVSQRKLCGRLLLTETNPRQRKKRRTRKKGINDHHPPLHHLPPLPYPLPEYSTSSSLSVNTTTAVLPFRISMSSNVCPFLSIYHLFPWEWWLRQDLAWKISNSIISTSVSLVKADMEESGPSPSYQQLVSQWIGGRDWHLSFVRERRPSIGVMVGYQPNGDPTICW